jgi:hypothetical protein
LIHNLLEAAESDLPRATKAVSIRIVSTVSASHSAAEAVGGRKRIGLIDNIVRVRTIQRCRPGSRRSRIKGRVSQEHKREDKDISMYAK